MITSMTNSSYTMVKPKLQRQKTMAANKLPMELSPIKTFSSLKRKNTDTLSSDRFSAFTPIKPSKRRKTNRITSVPESEPISWVNGLKNILSTTVHECKIGVSTICPWPLGFSMQCKVLLQNQDPKTGTFGLIVLCYRTSSSEEPLLGELLENENCEEVGGSMKAKTVKTGNLCVRLLSHDVEADVQHGEHASLMKFERFTGRDFELQFACKFKVTPKSNSVFGKVMVEHLDDYGNSEVLFDFNLSKKAPKLEDSSLCTPEITKASSNLHPSNEDTWSAVTTKGLATYLCIDDVDDSWMDFATYLGYNEEEIEQQLAITLDPIMAIFKLYKAQGRDPKDFVQAMYETSRKLGLKKAGVIDTDDTGSEFDSFNLRSYSQQCSGADAVAGATDGGQQGNAEHEHKAQKLILKHSNSLEKEGIHLEQNICKDDDLFDAATVVLPEQTTELEEIKEIPSTAVMPPTPPPTPKRRGWSESTCSSPGIAKIQQMSRDMNTILHSDEDCAADQIHRDCSKVLSESILWQVSSHVKETWRSLGRALDVKEVDLMCIEYSATDAQDQAYRTLYRWKEHVVDQPTYGALYTALCHPTVNLRMVANRYCTLDGVGVA